MAEPVASAGPRRRAPGERSRGLILNAAVRLASVEGLDGLSIGRLADEVGMPKSSVYVLFGSKEELQLATIHRARASFVREVIRPAAARQPGLERLDALAAAFLSYVERRVFPGGCFFVSAAAEVGARTGRVHDLVAQYQREWTDALRAEVHEAQARSQLGDDVDADQLAFEISSLLSGTNLAAVLHGDSVAIDRGRRAVRDRLAHSRPAVGRGVVP